MTAAKSVIFQHILYFRVGKAEVFIKTAIGNWHHFKIIQSGKNTLFCHPQTSGQHSKEKMFIGFQGMSEQAADQVHHLVIVFMLLCLIQRNVVLVNQKDRLLIIVFVKKGGQTGS